MDHNNQYNSMHYNRNIHVINGYSNPINEGRKLKWREVSQQEYQEAFRLLRQIINLIEHDPRISGSRGFELKQELREVARTLVRVEKEIYGEIWGLDGSK
jgi:hypothetical protein